MLATILSFLTSTAFGGIVGMVGSWLTKREERKNLQLKYDYDSKIAEIRKEETRIEAEHELAMADKQIERAQVEGEIAVTQEEVKAFQESLKEQSKTYGVKFVDAIRGLMRPVITIYLLGIATALIIQISMLVGGLESLSQSELFLIYRSIIDQILFLTSASVTWWFGSRTTKK